MVIRYLITMLVAQAGEIVPKINVSFTPVKIEDIFPMENPNQYIFYGCVVLFTG